MRAVLWLLTATFALIVVGCGGKNDETSSNSDKAGPKTQSNQDPNPVPEGPGDENAPGDDAPDGENALGHKAPDGGGSPSGATKERPANASPLNLSYITDTYFAAAIIRPADIIAEKIIQGVPTDAIPDDVLGELGLKPDQVEEIVVLFGADSFDPSSQPSVILRLVEGVETSSLIEKLASQDEVKTSQYNGFTIHAQSFGPSVTSRGREILLTGSEDKLKAMLDANNAESPLIDKLKQVDSSRQVAFAFSLAPVRDTIHQLIDSGASNLPAMAVPMVNAAKSIDSGIIYIDLAHDNLLDLQLEATDETGGTELSSALQNGVSLLKLFYPGFKAKIQEDAPFPLDESLLKVSDELIGSLTIEQQGTSVSLTVGHPVGLAEAVSAAVEGAAEAAKAMSGVNNVKKIMIAFHNYHDTFKSFPPSKYGPNFDENGKPHLSWRVHLLPFLEELALYERFHLDEPWDSEHNITLLAEMPAIYKTTSDPTKTTLMGFVSDPKATVHGGLTQSPTGGGPRFAQFSDGISHTGVVFEFPSESAVTWTQPIDYLYEPEKPLPKLGKTDEDFVVVGFADGSTSKIKKSVEEKLWRAIITRDGYEQEQVDYSKLGK